LQNIPVGNYEMKKKNSLKNFINENKTKGIYNDVFSSLQILMNEIIKENYEPNVLIYNIIEKLPKVVKINAQIVKLLQEKYRLDLNQDLNLFSIDCLVPFLEYFESLCWDEIKLNICEDYKIDLSEENKKYIIDYFEKNKNPENFINKNNTTNALRKLLSRSIAGRREEVDIKSDSKLNNYMNQEYLWDKNIFDDKNFEPEISKLFKEDILIKNAFSIFNLLEGEKILNEEIKKDNEEEKGNEIVNNGGGEIIQVNDGKGQLNPQAKPPNNPKKEGEEKDDEEEEKEDS